MPKQSMRETIIEVMKLLGACADEYIEGAVCRKLRLSVGDSGYHATWTSLVASGVARRVRPGVYEYTEHPIKQDVPWA